MVRTLYQQASNIFAPVPAEQSREPGILKRSLHFSFSLVIKSRLMRCLRWLFPYWFSDIAKCAFCGAVGKREFMVHNEYGWFCNQSQSDEFWEHFQW
jgi:hypothetical protein